MPEEIQSYDAIEWLKKSNPEKHESKSFHTKDIFIFSDYLVDVMTAHIDMERQKKIN